ncbi:MCE family protein [Nocardioides mesophilus]|uniref:MCE family protein n=1 Tax=Nocardioides mesophilus TaxID=433659 RepID=A0A7G9R6Y7_9ACTN|nr:MCE family protein [Nocardioides mesophilus]QNN51362.1 MCE family protein [Nocardioides mesophilus]
MKLLVVGKHRALGVAFLVLLLLSVWLTYAIFTKKFVDYVPVSVKASKIGLQLPRLADVKIRGVIVGDVREISSDGDGATLRLAIDPDLASTIPANTTARILPKTLFGEKYVALQVPASPSPKSIAAGAVIRESRVAIEVERVLSDLYPLLRTVQPAELNYTLTALATALEGRGEALGENLVVLEDYLARVNPKVPLLVDDLRKLGAVSETYRAAMPELANILRNSVTTGNTLVAKEQKLTALFSDVASFSSTSRDFLEQNGANIIRLSEQGQQQLPLFAKYSSEYPCLLQTMVRWTPRMESAYRGYTLHINLETLPRQPRGYEPRDDPAYADERGPLSEQSCRAAPGYSQRNLPGDRYSPQLQTGVDYPVGKRVPRAST